MKKLVSLLIPVYNVEKFIKKCIESLFCQTYDNIEYVFVNDCTKDESMSIIHDIIEKYSIEKSRVTIVNHNENKGISITRNDCLHYAKGDYILFIDSDDWIDCDMIEILINKANEDQADIVGCGYIEEFEDQSVVYLQDYPSDYFKILCFVVNSFISLEKRFLPKFAPTIMYNTIPIIIATARYIILKVKLVQ